MLSSGALQLVILGLTDFVFVLACSRLLPPSLSWQAGSSLVRAWIALTVVGGVMPVWLAVGTGAGLLLACLDSRGGAALALLVCPCLEEAFFRGGVMGVDMWLPLRAAVSTMWFVSAHDFVDWYSRGLRSLLYCFAWEQWGLSAAAAAHVTVNVAKRIIASRNRK
jgi:hypothetical protein